MEIKIHTNYSPVFHRVVIVAVIPRNGLQITHIVFAKPLCKYLLFRSHYILLETKCVIRHRGLPYHLLKRDGSIQFIAPFPSIVHNKKDDRISIELYYKLFPASFAVWRYFAWIVWIDGLSYSGPWIFKGLGPMLCYLVPFNMYSRQTNR